MYNENTGLYSDYVGIQWEPILSKKGILSEPIEWREDGACGAGKENSLGFPAKCNHPYRNDPQRNIARCCMFSSCQIDPICEGKNFLLFKSIDDDYTTKMAN